MCSQNLIQKIVSYKGHNCRPNDFLQLETKKAHTKYGKRMIEYAGPRLWNALPVEVRKEQKIDSFKKEVKMMLFRDTEGFVRKAFMYT